MKKHKRKFWISVLLIWALHTLNAMAAQPLANETDTQTSEGLSLDISMSAGLTFATLAIEDSAGAGELAHMVGNKLSPVLRIATGDLLSAKYRYFSLRLESAYVALNYDKQEVDEGYVDFGSSVSGRYFYFVPMAYINLLGAFSSRQDMRLSPSGGNALIVGGGIGLASIDLDGSVVYTHPGADRSIKHRLDIDKVSPIARIFLEVRHKAFYSSLGFSYFSASAVDEAGRLNEYYTETLELNLGYALLF